MTKLVIPMSPRQFRDEVRLMEKRIGPKAEIGVYVDSGRYGRTNEPALSASLYASGGYPQERTFDVRADTFEEILALIAQKWAEHKHVHTVRETKRMALAIISATDEHGECTAHHLRAARFTEDEVLLYGPDAILRADEMSGKRPFSILFVKGNGEPVEGEA